MPQFAAAWSAVKAAAAWVAAGKGVTAFVVRTALTLAATHLASRALMRSKANNGEGPGFQMEQDPKPITRVIYGKCRASGPIAFYHSTGDKNKIAHIVILLAEHECDGIEDVIWLNDVQYRLNPSTGEIIGKYAGRLTVYKHLGAEDQTADAALIANCPGFWTSADRIRGTTYVYVRLSHDTSLFPSGMPNLSFLVRGKKCYDPRTTLTTFTRNPALILRDYLANTRWGMLALPEQIVDSTFIAAANVCDEAVPKSTGVVTTANITTGVQQLQVDTTSGIREGMNVVAAGIPTPATVVYIDEYENEVTIDRVPTSGGTGVAITFNETERRYECGGSFTTDVDPGTIIEHIEASMAGRCAPVGGRWQVKAGAYAIPSRTLTVDDLRDGMTVRMCDPWSQACNRVTATFSSPSDGYVIKPAAPVVNATYLAEDSGYDRIRELSLAWVQSGSQSQRLEKIELEQSRQGITVTFPAKFTLFDVGSLDTVMLTVAEYGWTNKPFEVVELRISDSDDGIDITLRETAAGVYDWAGGEETTIDLADNTDLPDPTVVSAPVGLALASGTAHLVKGSDGTIVSRILATWTPEPDIPGGIAEIEAKKTADADWFTVGRASVDTGRIYVAPVEDGVAYDLRVRHRNGIGVASAWSTVTGHTVIGKTAAPGAPSNLTATGVVEAISLEMDAPADPDLSAVEIYESATTTQPGTPTFSISAVPGSHIVYPRSGLSGGATRHYWARARDTSGNVSSVVGPVNATALAPSGGTQGPPGDAGPAGITAILQHNNSLTWVRAPGGGIWTPATNTTTLTVTFKQGATTLASRTLVVTLNTTDGTLSATAGTVSGITASLTGNGTAALSVQFVHDASGAATAQTLSSTQGGSNGQNGVSGAITHDNTLSWLRAPDAGAWAPNTTGTTLTATFYRDGSSIASRTLAVGFASGVLTATGGTVSGIVASVAGSGTGALSVVFTHSASGASVSVALNASQGGSTGAAGNPGANAPVVRVTTTSQIFAHPQAGGVTPASVTLTATTYNVTSPTYQWQYWSGSTWTNASSTASTQSVASGDFTGVRTYRCLVNGTYSDTITIAHVYDGTNGATGAAGFSAWLTNEAHSCPAAADGTVSDPVAQSALGDVIAYKGATALTPVASSPGAGQFAIVVGSGLTKVDNDSYRVTNAAALTSDANVFTITVNLEGAVSFTKLFAVSKSRQGVTGATGLTGATGDIGPGPVFRGTYVAGGTYYHNPRRRDIVVYGGAYYVTNNAAKDGANTWGTPLAGDWVSFGAVYSSVATDLLLAQDVSILRTLIMGDGSAGAGVIRSNGASAYGSGAGFWLGYDGTVPKFRVGNPAGERLAWDGSSLFLRAGAIELGTSFITRFDQSGVRAGYGDNTYALVDSAGFKFYRDHAGAVASNVFAVTGASVDIGTGFGTEARGFVDVKAHGGDKTTIGAGYLLGNYGPGAPTWSLSALGLTFGDVSLFREAADWLRTNDNFRATGLGVFDGSRVEVGGSGYAVPNDSRVRLGAYAGYGYIQAPVGSHVDIWTHGTAAIARFNNDRSTDTFGATRVNVGSGAVIGFEVQGGDGNGVEMALRGTNSGYGPNWKWGVVGTAHPWGAGMYLYDVVSARRALFLRANGQVVLGGPLCDVNGNQVVGTRASAIGNPSFDLGSVQGAVIAILGMLRGHGLISS